LTAQIEGCAFQMTAEQLDALGSQVVTSNGGRKTARPWTKTSSPRTRSTRDL